jgi:hypothetical protein
LQQQRPLGFHRALSSFGTSQIRLTCQAIGLQLTSKPFGASARAAGFVGK